ncbi:MAG: cytochrome P450 [Solirubrobacteraceae bacterium]
MAESTENVPAPEEINFFDPPTNDCPYHAYEAMREQAPVWKDPVTGMYTITRYEDVRAALLDVDTFTNKIGNSAGATEKGVKPDDPEKARELLEAAAVEEQLQKLYEEKGWPVCPTLSGRDEPEHMSLRRLFDWAFRPQRVRELDPFVESLANRLFDAFLDDGRCEWVKAFAIPLPLYVIGKQMGVPDEDMPQIKKWTDAWIQRMGLMQSAEEKVWSAEQEIEAQHYFQKRYESLREHPNDSLLSDLVNNEVKDWKRNLTDNELHSEMMADLFVGGSETTTNALSGGVMLLIRNPNAWEQLKSDPDKYLEPFVEEVLRLESPVQCLLRETAKDITLHGVQIPAGSIVSLRYAAANRDTDKYERATELDLERPNPRSHLAFGLASHHCLGAPLARRELYYGFKVLVERIEDLWFIEGANDFRYHQNYFLRALKELHIGFTPRKVAAAV